jgi:hypothetical protein
MGTSSSLGRRIEKVITRREIQLWWITSSLDLSPSAVSDWDVRNTVVAGLGGRLARERARPRARP